MTVQALLVTGASTGIGRATALLAASRGFRVFAGVRRAQDGESLVAAASGADIVPVMLDVTSPEQIAAAVKTIADSGASLAGLVNNAGLAVAAPLEFVPVAEFRSQLDVNVVGQLAVTQAVLPLLRAAKGRIVNITSIGGLISGPMLGPYHASKFALEAMTDTLRMELAPWGIGVVAIEPGQIATPIWSTASARANSMVAAMPPEALEFYGRGIAGARASAKRAEANGLPPERVAEVILTALTAKRPKTRYLVGSDAKLIGRVIRHLPDRVRDRVMLARRSG